MREALSAARRVNIREFMWMHFAIAAAAGRLGRLEDARAAAAEMTRLAPFLADPANLREFVVRWYWPPDLIEALLDGVLIARSRDVMPSAEPRRGGSHAVIPSGPGTSAGAASLMPTPGSLRSGIAVAVRPFTSSGTGEDGADGRRDADLRYRDRSRAVCVRPLDRRAQLRPGAEPRRSATRSRGK